MFVLHKGNNYHISCCIGFACIFCLKVFWLIGDKTLANVFVSLSYVHLQQIYEQKWNFEWESYVQ